MQWPWKSKHLAGDDERNRERAPEQDFLFPAPASPFSALVVETHEPTHGNEEIPLIGLQRRDASDGGLHAHGTTRPLA